MSGGVVPEDYWAAMLAAAPAPSQHLEIQMTDDVVARVGVVRDVLGRPIVQEDLARFLHDEVHDYGDDWTWPDHEDDTGRREGGYVRLTPTDVRLECRDEARRIWIFLGLDRFAAQASPPAAAGDDAGSFQARAKPWVVACFGDEVACDELERMDRFVEEVFEAVQSRGYDPARIDALKAYVYGREPGETRQEIGGVMMTLAAWCNAIGEDMHASGETELTRVWGKVETIRAKQAAKPKGSALLVAVADRAQARGGAGAVAGLPSLEVMVERLDETLPRRERGRSAARLAYALTGILSSGPHRDAALAALSTSGGVTVEMDPFHSFPWAHAWGDAVVKVTGYRAPGVVRGFVLKSNGAPLYAVEHEIVGGDRFQHLYSPASLEPASSTARLGSGTDGAGFGGWRDIGTAPYGQEVEVRAGMMRFRAKLLPDASINSDTASCDQWQATREGEHPPCWTDGACWEVNADLSPSLQPEAWRPLEIAPVDPGQGGGHGPR